MAATLQQHRATNGNTAARTTNTATNPNPKLKRLVYSKYRELLGSYNDQANAYIDTLPSYMVQKDTGFNLDFNNSNLIVNSATPNGSATNHRSNEMYGAGQRMPAQQTYEAPACVQNAMMTKDKKPFTYTPGGIDLSQIKSERMAKRLARNAQAEGATGIQQQNRPTQPQSPASSSATGAASMGAAAMGMPFQVLPPPPPPPAPGKNFNGGSAPAPPLPPQSSSNFSNVGTLAPPNNGVGGGVSAPNSPNMPRKSPTPQRFEPPPMGFRPEIKIPSNPMAALRKVPPPVEKNTFWKDEYVKDRSKSPMVDLPPNKAGNDSVDSNSNSLQTRNANNIGTANMSNDNIDGFQKTMPTTTANNSIQQNQTNNNYTNYQQPQQQQQQQLYTPPPPTQQSPNKPLQQSPQYGGSQHPPTTQLQQTHITQQSPQPQQQQPQQQQSVRPEFRSVAAPTSPAVNVYTRQTDSPRTAETGSPARASESPFKFSQQQQRSPAAVSPLALQQNTPSTASPLALQQNTPSTASPLALQQNTPSTSSSVTSVSPNNPAQTVPWRTQRAPSQQPQPSAVAQSHPQPIYNNVQQQPQQTPDFSAQQSTYQGPKPANVGSLYIAPLAPTTEPQAQHIVRHQMQQQQRDIPVHQMTPHQPQPQPQPQQNQQLRWMSSQPTNKEQPAWARPEENGNVVPSSLNRIKSPPPPPQNSSSPSQAMNHNMYQPMNPGNGFMPHNFGAQPITTTGLRLQINTPVNLANTQNGPKERIIPIQLEQTPTYSPAQPSFNHAVCSNSPAPGYVMRTPNQFVDQGYNNFGQQQAQQQQQLQQQTQRVISPTLQQLNAPRLVQQTQYSAAAAGNKTHIIPITIENNEGTRGPISKTPVVIQNDQRTPPVQSKSFRILQKITDTIDDGTNDNNVKKQQPQQPQHMVQEPIEPQLQRPTFARQMSAQQAHHSPTVEQMRRMQIGQEQGNNSAPTTPSAFKYNQQISFNDNSQKYIPPSEQHVPEPKIYTGSAIPSRSFKILQAMTQPENADNNMNHKGKPENCAKTNEMNEIERKAESHHNFSSSKTDPVLSSSSSTINNELAFSCSSTPTPPPTQSIPYPPYPYAYGYPWYLPTPPTHSSAHILNAQTNENCYNPNWHYAYGMPTHTTPIPLPPVNGNNDYATHYPTYPYYYPCYPPPFNTSQHHLHLANLYNCQTSSCKEYDVQNMYSTYMPPPPPPPPLPYLAYPYAVAPSYSQASNSSRASSVLPDIIITPSTDDVPSKVIMQHHIKVEKASAKQRAGSLEIEDVSCLKVKPSTGLEQQPLNNIRTKCLMNNIKNKNYQNKKSFKKNVETKTAEENTSPGECIMEGTDMESETELTSSDSEVTPKQVERKGAIPLKSIRSVNNIQIYKGQKLQQMPQEFSYDSEETKDDDETTADGESDIFDEENEDEETNHRHDFELEEDSETEDFPVDDSLSVIYEEESELDHKTLKQTATKKNDQQQEEECNDSTSVTVRLPLKFSFSSTKDDENIATVEVGRSQIKEKFTSNAFNEQRNKFSKASIMDSDTEQEYDDCDVSVTISLSQTSRSSSLSNQQVYQNIDHLYPIESMPLPAEQFEKEDKSSPEDNSVSYSLNRRKKFALETNHTQTCTKADKEAIKKQVTEKEVNEDFDFFATLRATKMQALKIKEQSASYWGKSQEKPEKITESQETSSEKLRESKKKTLKKTKSKSQMDTKTEQLKASEEMLANQDKKDNNETCKRDKFSFWNRCASPKPEEKEHKQQLDEQTENKRTMLQETKWKINQSVQEISTNQLQDDKKANHLSCEQTQSIAAVQESEEIADIWADREEDLPPIKPIKSKLKSLETARQSFWSCVSANETQHKNKEESCLKPLTPAETISKVDLHIPKLSPSIQQLTAPQKAFVDYIEEETESVMEESIEVNFWDEIEKAKQNSNQLNLATSFEEPEYSMYNDDMMPTAGAFDPFKYPQEPREVDTDEEIDFWQEIEAKRQAQDNDVSFEKSASFWASRECRNSVDETPYQPVLPKAFHAKLPDEPPTENISIWEALAAHKGEEPIIIDPLQEEEKFLAQQYDVMAKEQQFDEEEEEELYREAQQKSAASTEVKRTQNPNLDPEIQDKAENPHRQKNENDELEIKRNNYRKARAFFTTSIEENKEQTNERGQSKSARNSYYIEEENEQWDWEAVNEALQQAKPNETNKGIVNAKEPTPPALKDEQNNRCSDHVDKREQYYDLTSINTNTDQDKTISNKIVTHTNDKAGENHITNVFREQLLPTGSGDSQPNRFNEQRKMSVKDRICAFETATVEKTDTNLLPNQSLSVDSSTRQCSLSRNSSTQRSESEMDEDDSGVTDMNKQLSETDTESESFPELRKMSSYQRAATHSRLFKLLQNEPDLLESQDASDDYQLRPSRKKIVHNVSITRKQNPVALAEAETMSQRRERLSLPLCKNTSIDNDNPSTPNSPASPIMCRKVSHKTPVVSEKLVSELVQSLLLKSDSSQFRKLPMEKLQAAAKRVLEEELDSLENTSSDSTPALTPSDMKNPTSYNDYYNSWSDAVAADDIVPSKSFRALQDSRRSPWTARCPRVLSSKTINRDLARVTESPEISINNNNRQSREPSIGKWKKM